MFSRYVSTVVGIYLEANLHARKPSSMMLAPSHATYCELYKVGTVDYDVNTSPIAYAESVLTVRMLSVTLCLSHIQNVVLLLHVLQISCRTTLLIIYIKI